MAAALGQEAAGDPGDDGHARLPRAKQSPSVESNCILRQQQILKASVEGAVLGAVGQFDREVRAKSTEKKLTSHGSRHGIG